MLEKIIHRFIEQVYIYIYLLSHDYFINAKIDDIQGKKYTD